MFTLDIPTGPAATIDARIDQAIATLEPVAQLEAAMHRSAIMNAVYGLLESTVFGWPRTEALIHPGQGEQVDENGQVSAQAVEPGTVIIGAATASATISTHQDGQGNADLHISISTEPKPVDPGLPVQA